MYLMHNFPIQECECPQSRIMRGIPALTQIGQLLRCLIVHHRGCILINNYFTFWYAEGYGFPAQNGCLRRPRLSGIHPFPTVFYKKLVPLPQLCVHRTIVECTLGPRAHKFMHIKAETVDSGTSQLEFTISRSFSDIRQIYN